MELSISEIARLAGKSERTIARWLDKGPLAGSKRLPNGKYEIDETALLTKRPMDENAVMLAHLREIKQILLTQADQIAGLHERIEHLEEEIRAGPARKQIAGPSIARSHPRPSTREQAEQGALFAGDVAQDTPLPAEMPAGSIRLSEMAAQIGIGRTTLQQKVTNEQNKSDVGLITTTRGKRTYQHYAFPREGRPHERDRYFSPEQAEQVRAEYGKM